MKQYIEKNKERFFEELFSLMRIPSISAKKEHKDDMLKCANRLKELLLEAGADEAGVYPTDGNPVVFGKKTVSPKAKTVMVYGHYDVQPAEPLEKWKSDPFKPEVHDGAIWGRGANDDKGQLFMHIKAFEYLVKSKKLKHNVKFIFEGEEEIGSPSLPAWVKKNKRNEVECLLRTGCDDDIIGVSINTVRAHYFANSLTQRLLALARAVLQNFWTALTHHAGVELGKIVERKPVNIGHTAS